MIAIHPAADQRILADVLPGGALTFFCQQYDLSRFKREFRSAGGSQIYVCGFLSFVSSPKQEDSTTKLSLIITETEPLCIA